jgi:hypothetical protein
MKTGRGFPGFIEQLGLTERADSPDVSIALAYPVPHLAQHRFPQGCGQQFGQISQAAVAAQHGGMKIVGGTGGFHLTHLGPVTAAVSAFFFCSRPPGSALTEAAVALNNLNQLPANNGLSTTFSAVLFTAATVGAIPARERFSLDLPNTFTALLEFGDSFRIPPGHLFYAIGSVANTLQQMSVIGWDSCEDT